MSQTNVIIITIRMMIKIVVERSLSEGRNRACCGFEPLVRPVTPTFNQPTNQPTKASKQPRTHKPTDQQTIFLGHLVDFLKRIFGKCPLLDCKTDLRMLLIHFLTQKFAVFTFLCPIPQTPIPFNFNNVLHSSMDCGQLHVN